MMAGRQPPHGAPRHTSQLRIRTRGCSSWAGIFTLSICDSVLLATCHERTLPVVTPAVKELLKLEIEPWGWGSNRSWIMDTRPEETRSNADLAGLTGSALDRWKIRYAPKRQDPRNTPGARPWSRNMKSDDMKVKATPSSARDNTLSASALNSLSWSIESGSVPFSFTLTERS